MEEENKSLSLRIADFESSTFEASRDFGVHLIEGNDKNAVLHQSAGFWCFPGSHQVPQEEGNSTSPMEKFFKFNFSNGGVRQRPERSIHRVARSLGRHFQWKNSSLLFLPGCAWA